MLAGIEVSSVNQILYDFDPNVMVVSNPDFILFVVLNTLGNTCQLSLRLYLKFVKNIQDSNEIFTHYFAIILFILCLLPLINVALGLSLKIVHYILCILCYIVVPLTMIIFHERLNQYFFNKHTKLKVFVINISEFFHCTSCVTSPPEEDLPLEDSEDQDPYSAKNMEAMANQAGKRIAESAESKAKHDLAQAQASESVRQAWALQSRDHCLQPQASTSHSTHSFNLPTYLQRRENDMTVIDVE